MLNGGAAMDSGREPTWSEKFGLISGELQSNPARSDGLIAKTLGVVSKASVYRIREALVADGKVRDVPLTERLSISGAMANANGARNFRNRNGNRIPVPPGKTVVDLCRDGIAAEEAGMIADDAARLIGIGSKSYREARAIVLLASRTDLSPTEAALVRGAVEEMNRTYRTVIPHKRLASLVERVWGKRNPRDRRSAQKRVASFSHAMTIVIDTCLAAPDINVPFLSDGDRVTAVKQIEEAMVSLRKLKQKVVNGRWK